MAFNKGKQIRPFDNAQGPEVVGVVIGGRRRAVPVHLVSRETLNGPDETIDNLLVRFARGDRRKRRMKLRKRRGWR